MFTIKIINIYSIIDKIIKALNELAFNSILLLNKSIILPYCIDDFNGVILLNIKLSSVDNLSVEKYPTLKN